MKTISEVQGRVGDKKAGKGEKKVLDKKTRDALLAAVVLMKEVFSSSDLKRVKLCLDLKRKIEDVEREFGTSLI